MIPDGLAAKPNLVSVGEGWTPLPRRRERKVSQQIAADLRRQILTGELAEDQRLPSEARLTAMLQVSRETLREALRILESEALIEIRRGRGGGAVVRRPDMSSVARYVGLLLQLRRTTLADLEEARAVIEPRAAGALADRVDAEHLELLVALHDAERRAEGDPLRFATAVSEFDRAVAELSGNRIVPVLAGVLRDIYTGQVYSAVGSTDIPSAQRIERRVVVAHSAFLDAARRRDSTLAQTVWAEYLEGTCRLLVDRRRSRLPIDVVPLWRVQEAQRGSGAARRAATSLASEIRCRIAEGRLAEGDRLPGLADLAAEFEVSLPTLREGLRILETEQLIELRTGDRGGATIRLPNAQVAAQLAGIVLESRQLTLADFHSGVTQFEPDILRFAARRITKRRIAEMRAIEAEMSAAAEHTARFRLVWWRGTTAAFAAAKNPALAVVTEIIDWVLVGTWRAVNEGAEQLPWVAKTNRNAVRYYSKLVDALADHDGEAAARTWAEFLDAYAPFVLSSELGRRLVVDLIER